MAKTDGRTVQKQIPALPLACVEAVHCTDKQIHYKTAIKDQCYLAAVSQ